jgi:hypothetical protein
MQVRRDNIFKPKIGNQNFHQDSIGNGVRIINFVCNNSISPIASGCFIWANIRLVIVLVDISNFVISEVVYINISFGINEIVFAKSLKF